MNLGEEQPTQIQPTQQVQFHLRTCPTHPNESFTGFCPACLCERLAGLETSASTSNSTRPKPNTSTASAALKAIFRTGDNKNNNKGSRSNSVLPELRRCKSFSGGKGEGFSGVFEPQRRSCDVRGRSSLWCLFSQDDERKLVKKSEIEIESSDLGFSGGVTEPVKEEEELEQEVEQEEEEIRVSNVGEIIEEEEIVQVGAEEEEEEKRMKDHIEIDSQTKKAPSRDLKEIAGNFWTAASVFSKKLQKWRSKQKRKKSGRGGGSAGGVGDGASTTMQVEKPYSEIGDYGFGRRSCDIDPRFSLDAARMSFDDPRYSWDEPRASWDGYMIGRMFPRVPPMVSVVEHVGRVDDQIPVEEPIVNEGDGGGDTTPGGTSQTRDYYSDSSRRKSLDRSNSIRKKAAAVVAELDETLPVSNAKVTPATTEILYGSKLLGTDKNPRDLLSHSHSHSRSNSNSHSHSLRDDCSESFESVFRDNASIASGKGLKKSRRWSKAWNIWGLISKRGGNKDEEDERYSRGNVVQRSFSESWPELRREANGEVKNGFNRMLRSNSSVSSRNSFSMSGSVTSMRRTAAETNGHGKKKKEECVLERNRSARYSPNDVDNGLLRFYLTPMRSSSRRNGGGMSRPKTSHSIASSVLRLY